MGTIQTYQGGQVKARGLAEVRRGNYATAEHFGAGRARDLQNFGAAVQNVGGTMMEIANIKQERIDRTTVRDEMTGLSNQYRDWEREALKKRKGMAAADLDKDGEKWFQERRREIEARLKTKRQKDLFGPQFDAQSEGAKNALFRYSVQQVEAGEKISRDVQNENFINESTAKGLMNDDLVATNRALIHTNIEANFVGHKPEVIEAAKQKADAALYGAMVDAHAARSLENALEYLKRDNVKKAFTTAEYNALEEKLKLAKEKKDTDEEDQAAALFAIEQRAAGKSLEELQPALIEKYGYKRGKLAYSEAVTRENLEKAKQAKEAEAETDRRWEAFMESPTHEIPAGTPYNEKLSMLQVQDRLAKGEKSTVDPWAFAEDLMANYEPEQLQKMKRDGKWGEIYAKLNPNGTKTDAYNDVLRYSNGEPIRGLMTPEKFARSQWIQATGKRPVGKNEKDYTEYISAFNLAAEERAEALELKDVRHLPREEQEKIINHLLEPGDWTGWNFGWVGWDWLNFDYRRYQAMGWDGYEKYFKPKAKPEGGAGATYGPAPAPTVTGGRRDKTEARAGGTEITTPNGTVQQVSEDGRTILSHMPRPESEEELGEEFFDENHDEPEHPEILKEMLDYKGAYRRWRGTHWEVTVPAKGVFGVKPDGMYWGI